MYNFSLRTAPTFQMFTASNAVGQSLRWDGTNWLLQEADGRETILQAPGSVTARMSQIAEGPPVFGNTTSAQAINNRGQVVGSYLDGVGKIHGFVYFQGEYRTVDIAGSAAVWVQGIDDFGTIAGVYLDPHTGMQEQFEAATHSFLVSDQSNGTHWSDDGFMYHGPLTTLNDEYIIASDQNINVLAETPNVFVHTNSGDDAIQVTAGANVLDGGTGSNFLVGGSGSDQFFIDARSLSKSVWSTVANFHPGDTAVIWGMRPSDKIQWQDDAGATGFHGLTGGVTEPDGKTVNITIVDYRVKDLGSRLQMSYGHTKDTPDLPGSDYMLVSFH